MKVTEDEWYYKAFRNPFKKKHTIENLIKSQFYYLGNSKSKIILNFKLKQAINAASKYGIDLESAKKLTKECNFCGGVFDNRLTS